MQLTSVRATNNTMDLAPRTHCRYQCKPMTSLLPLSVSPTIMASKPKCKSLLSFKKHEYFLQCFLPGSTVTLPKDFHFLGVFCSHHRTIFFPILYGLSIRTQEDEAVWAVLYYLSHLLSLQQEMTLNSSSFLSPPNFFSSLLNIKSQQK